MSGDYFESRHPALTGLKIELCYICGELLSDDSTLDHIIPNTMFRPGDPSRPQLPVHLLCNNAKSKDDRWCVNFLRFFAGFNPEAVADLKGHLLDKATAEKPYSRLIGHKTPNYNLAMGLLGTLVPGLELKQGQDSLYQFHVPKANAQRVNDWIKPMCRGLFIRNVPESNPPEPKLIWNQHAQALLNGNIQLFVDPVQKLINSSGSTSFGQQWDGRITYIGSRVSESPDKGFLFIHFYGQVGILATFGVKAAL